MGPLAGAGICLSAELLLDRFDGEEVVVREDSAEIDAITGEMSPCDHCRTQKYETYVLLTVLRRALVQSMED